MQFDISTRIETRHSIEEVRKFTFEQFKKIGSGIPDVQADHVIYRQIEASFGSINRTDRTAVKVSEVEGGCIVTADVRYNPSLMFWVFVAVGLFTYIGWLLPIALYFYQKSAVKTAIETSLKRIKDEFQQSTAPPEMRPQLKDLEQLASLRDKGIISDQEFAAKKSQILGI